LALRLKAIAAVVLALAVLQASTFAEAAPALGQIVQADRARLGGGAASGGATLFDGDRLSTGASGSLRVKLGTGQLILVADSAAAVRRSSTGATASLERGTAIFSMADPGTFVLEALDVRFRAHSASNESTLGQVTLTTANEFVVTCNRGALDVLIGNEVRTVTAESSYRVVLDPPDPQEPAGAGAGAGKDSAEKHPAAYRNHLARWIFLGAVGGLTAYFTWRALHRVSEN
jgi:hypothetical protein